jgi:hypothetical protein
LGVKRQVLPEMPALPHCASGEGYRVLREMAAIINRAA